MLKAHLDAVEATLLTTSRIPANAGHTLHRGTPRETFIRKFLEGHISSRAAIGTGEIIDANSTPREQRNQFDIVVFRSDYPRIDLGGGINAFLAESVIATIEVKSLLTEDELSTSIASANRAKMLKRNTTRPFQTGYVPPGILSFVVAYDGPASISTVHAWINRSETKQGLNQRQLPPTGAERCRMISDSLEGVIQLGRGSVIFDNSPISPITDAMRQANPSCRSFVLDQDNGNILWLFLWLTHAVSGTSAEWVNIASYLSRVQVQARFVP